MNLKIKSTVGMWYFALALALALCGCATINFSDDLLVAAESGNAKEVDRLLVNGANVNAKGKLWPQPNGII